MKTTLLLCLYALTPFLINAQSGNVGIGVINPLARLHVDSTVILTGVYDPLNQSSLPISGEGTRLMWIPRKRAFRVGSVDNNQWDLSSIGTSSIAMGTSPRASGNSSTAIGTFTTASEINSTAMGYFTVASGINSTAMGASTTASGEKSTAMGSSTIASNLASTALGSFTSASGFISTALGSATVASGARSTALGSGTIASGDISTAMGSSTSALGLISTAMGSSTRASTDYSTAMGRFTTASGFASTSIGYSTKATGYASTSIGYFTKATGYASTVLGMYNDSIISSQAAITPNTPLFIVGNGDSEQARSNALLVRKDGKVGIGTNSPGSAISTVKLEVNNGFIGVSNNYGVFSNNSAGTGIGAGFDTTTDDDLLLFTGGTSKITVKNDGKVGMGTSSPDRDLTISDPDKDESTFVNIKDPTREVLIGVNSSGGSLRTMTNHSLSFWTNGARHVTIDPVGNMGIGINTPNVALDVGGDIEYTGTITDVSDEKAKTQFQPLTNSLSKILALNPVSYVMKDDASGTRELGLIAQEVQSILPEIVKTVDPEKEYLGISYIQLVPILVKGIQEQQDQIQDLSFENEFLKDQLSKQEDRFKILEKRLKELEKSVYLKE